MYPYDTCRYATQDLYMGSSSLTFMLEQMLLTARQTSGTLLQWEGWLSSSKRKWQYQLLVFIAVLLSAFLPAKILPIKNNNNKSVDFCIAELFLNYKNGFVLCKEHSKEQCLALLAKSGWIGKVELQRLQLQCFIVGSFNVLILLYREMYSAYTQGSDC